MSNLIEKLRKIDEYFDNINTSEELEQFEKLLIECGYGRIKAGQLALNEDDILTKEDMWIYDVDSIYTIYENDNNTKTVVISLEKLPKGDTLKLVKKYFENKFNENDKNVYVILIEKN